MKPSRLLLPISLLFASVLPPAAATELRVTTILDGQTLELSGVDGDKRLLAGPDRRPATAKAVWTIEGDVRAPTAPVHWTPVTSILRANERKLQVTPDKPWIAEVQLRHLPTADVKNMQGGLAPLLFDWPEGLPNGGVAVLAWVVDGLAVDTILRPLPATTVEKPFAFAAEFRLTKEQAGRGQAVLLLWSDGSFIAPAPLFADAPANDAFHAICLDDPEALEKALAGGAKPDAVSRYGLALVHYAARAGSVRCLALLIKRQARSASQPDKLGSTPLHHAAFHGRTEAVSVLLAARAKADTKAIGVPPPSILAVRQGHTDSVALLLKSSGGAVSDPNADPLSDAIGQGFTDIADLLLAARMRYDFKAPSAGHDLLRAAVDGHISMVTWLVGHGVNPNSEIKGISALAVAARDGDASSARALLSAGAEVNKAAKNGITPLMTAAYHGNVDYAQVLIEAGADVRAVTARGSTALHRAAAANAPALVETLLARGAVIDARTKDDLNPLEAALSAGATDAARVLARHGATIDLSNPNAENMLATAVCYDVVEPVQSALRAGWPADSTFAGVWPAVRLAQLSRSERCLEALLAAGARPPNLNQPMPVALGKELDAPIKVARNAPVSDPRETNEEFPESIVTVSVLIDSAGRPLFPAIKESPDVRLGKAATESILDWRFHPPRRNGEPVAARATVPISFPASANRVLELDRVTQVPRAIKQVQPEFPEELKRLDIQGRVEIGLVVDKDGRTRDFMVIRATHPAFAAAAIEAMKKWVFTPGMIDGVPVNTRVKQPLSFMLQDGPDQ